MNAIEAAQSLYNKGEITKEELDKVAAWYNNPITNEKIKQTLKAVAKSKPMAIATLTGASVLGSSIAENIMLSKRNKDVFKRLPDISERIAAEDPEKVKAYFNIIKTFSPASASNALISSALIDKMIEWNGVDHKLVQDIAKIETPKKKMLINPETLVKIMYPSQIV